MRKKLLSLLVSVLLLLVSSLSLAEVSQCPSFTFSVNRDGVTHSLNVATLRRDRPELYELLRDDSIRGLYLGDAIADMAKRYNALMFAGVPPSAQRKEFERFIKFMIREIDTFSAEWLGACGSAEDNIVGELSLMFSKADGDELVKHLRNPVASRFLRFASSRKHMPMAKEISESFLGTAFQTAVAHLGARCRAEHFDTELCSRLERVSAPSTLRSADAQPIIPPGLSRQTAPGR